MLFSRIKGTQDFLDLTLFNFIVESSKQHLKIYQFTEIAVPILESVALFNRSLGSHTDVVTKEMFTITKHAESGLSGVDLAQTEDEGICLRPEATASIVRAFMEDGVQQTPWKVFTWGPMFRYERPQKGRYRQFHQISMEVIGANSIMEDVQFIKMLDRLFHERIKFNNYALLINFLGCASDRAAYQEKLKKFLATAPAGTLCANCMVRKEKNILRIFDCKNPQCQEFYQNAPVITDSLCTTCAQEWRELQETLELLSVAFVHKPTLVRGLDYYNKTVFEFVSDALGAQNAFCAGGRYELVQQLGGKQAQPSIGAAIGIERLMLVLEPVRATLVLPHLSALTVIIPVAAAQQPVALLLADELQARDISTQVLLEGDSIKSMMRHANKLGAAYCLIIGEDEQNKHEVTIKNMVTGSQERMAQADVVNYLKKI